MECPNWQIFHLGKKFDGKLYFTTLVSVWFKSLRSYLAVMQSKRLDSALIDRCEKSNKQVIQRNKEKLAQAWDLQKGEKYFLFSDWFLYSEHKTFPSKLMWFSQSICGMEDFTQYARSHIGCTAPYALKCNWNALVFTAD